MTYLTEDMTDWILAYRHYKNGYLPNDSAGWLKQCAKFLEVMYFIDSEIMKHEKEVTEYGRKRTRNNLKVS